MLPLQVFTRVNKNPIRHHRLQPEFRTEAPGDENSSCVVVPCIIKAPGLEEALSDGSRPMEAEFEGLTVADLVKQAPLQIQPVYSWTYWYTA